MPQQPVKSHPIPEPAPGRKESGMRPKTPDQDLIPTLPESEPPAPRDERETILAPPRHDRDARRLERDVPRSERETLLAPAPDDGEFDDDDCRDTLPAPPPERD